MNILTLGFSAITPDKLAQNPNLAVWQVISQVVAYLREEEHGEVEALARMYLQ